MDVLFDFAHLACMVLPSMLVLVLVSWMKVVMVVVVLVFDEFPTHAFCGSLMMNHFAKLVWASFLYCYNLVWLHVHDVYMWCENLQSLEDCTGFV